MSRPRHPKAEIEKAVKYAEQLGWSVKISNGHAWGRLLCPFSSRDGCILSVWSTPKNADNHARHIRKVVDACPHTNREASADGSGLAEDFI